MTDDTQPFHKQSQQQADGNSNTGVKSPTTTSPPPAEPSSSPQSSPPSSAETNNKEGYFGWPAMPSSRPTKDSIRLCPSSATPYPTSNTSSIPSLELISVTVAPFTGGPFSVSVGRRDSVDELKKAVAKKLKVLKDRICLLYRER